MPESNTPTLGFLISDLGRQLRTHFDRRVRVLGYTRAQWQAIKAIDRNEGINQSGLAELLEVEPITLCRLMDRMEKSGLVERRPDPEDRRAHRLFITEQSRQSSAELSSIGATLMAEVTDGLSPEELETLQSLLLRLRSNLAKVGTSS